VLMCDSKRLAHADSIVGKLRVVGLPTVVWIGSDLTESVEAPLVSVADHLVIDSQREDASQALGHASQLARRRPVHDLAWGRLAIWRRHIASAFEPSSAFRLLANLDSVGVAYSEGAEGVVALLWGWIAQRLGLSLKELRLGTTESVAQATSKIQSVGFHGAKQTESTPSGVIQEVCFRAGQDTIEIGLTHPQRSDVFADSLHPVDTFALGYDGALFQAYDALGMR
jgi:glucose-6-phosphate dehydrogenase assembly protein OpcA